MTIRLVLFDIDGTLVDSEAMILAAQAEAFAAFSLPMPDRARALGIVGLSLHEAFRELAGAEAPIDGLAEAYRAAFFRLRSEGRVPEPLFPGAAAAIRALAGDPRFTLGIATGKSRRGVDALIAREGWAGIFSAVETSDDHPSKPHPSMVLAACAKTGIAPAETVLVGDSSFDMAMAKAAGARAIGVRWGFQPPERLLETGAEALVADFVERRDRLAAG